MIAFKRYESRPITRLAYEIKSTDTITPDHDSVCHVRTEDGESISFITQQEVKAGDYIVYLKDEDIYHCAREVFHERNVVECKG